MAEVNQKDRKATQKFWSYIKDQGGKTGTCQNFLITEEGSEVGGTLAL